MDYFAEVCSLTPKFLSAYPQMTYPEIEQKPNRPYSCLLIDCFDGFFVCIPFRSSIHHANAFMFKHSVRSRQTASGLDYSKTLIIRDSDYLITNGVILDKDEFKETMINLPKITKEIVRYIENYKKHIEGTCILHPREFARKYQYSTLQYFHDLLFSSPL